MHHALLALGLRITIPALMLCRPVILPCVTILQRLQRRHLACISCPNCGAPFGRTEVDRARAACEELMRETIRQIIARGDRPHPVAIWRICGPAFSVKLAFPPSTDNLMAADSAPTRFTRTLTNSKQASRLHLGLRGPRPAGTC